MITDSVPRQQKRKEFYLRSDEMRTLDLPPLEPLRTSARELEEMMATENQSAIQRVCASLVACMAENFGVRVPSVAVLGVRPHRTDGRVCIYEKFGDYNLETARIRLWMRTAMRHKVTSYGTLLSTLCHEVCHHLDVVHFKFADTPHTRGFYERAAALYHHTRGTPALSLVWVPLARGLYRIDWAKTMRG